MNLENYIPVSLSYEESNDKNTVKLFKRYLQLKAENKNLTRTWNIIPGSEKPTMMKMHAIDKQTNEHLMLTAPSFGFLVDSAFFAGGIVTTKTKDDLYHITLYDLEEGSETEFPPVYEEMLIVALDLLINGNPSVGNQMAS